jgi:photosystem II stability/assembly factor-like uncharacterized protein
MRRRAAWPRRLVIVALMVAALGVARAGLGPQGLDPQGLDPQGLDPQGLDPQGLDPQGLDPQGLDPQGLDPQGLDPQGLDPQGLDPQGLDPQGLDPQGLDPQGLDPQGLDPQGLDPQGLDPQGLDPQGLDPQGLDPQGLDPQGLDPQGVHLQRGPGETGGGSFIEFPGLPNAAGTFWKLRMIDAAGAPAGAISLFIAGVERDTSENHSTSPRNDDVWLYTVYYRRPGTRTWRSLCPEDKYGQPHALAIPAGSGAPAGRFTFACTATGVAAKCARNWGYKWWKPGLEPYWRSCVLAARADYCQDGHSFTREGTLVDLYDSDGGSSFQPSAGWAYDPGATGVMMHEEYQVSVTKAVSDLMTPDDLMSLPPADQVLVSQLRASGLKSSRYADLDPGRACRAAPFIDRCAPEEPRACFSSRISKSRTVSYGTFIAVNSARYCAHPDDVVGEALDPLCNACASRVCAADPTCCGDRRGSYYPGSVVWAQKCVDLRAQVCRTSTGGQVWPAGAAALPPSGAPARFRRGAIGAVLGLDTAGNVQGWACDPDLPGASIRLRYSIGAPGPEQPLSLGAADLPVAPTWATDVAAACGETGGGSAPHAFRLPVPAGSGGKTIYVYGLDLAQPAAPATLIGRLPLPSCAHGEYASGGPLAASCSACAAKVCAEHPACCATGWDASCVAAASAGCATVACGHRETTAGDPLRASCSACAAKVCLQKPACCESGWDADCVARAGRVCADTTRAPNGCAHGEDTPGSALATSCSACAEKVCAKNAACCTTAWGAACVTEARRACGDMTCAHAESVVGPALRPGCSACTAKVCASLPACCASGWTADCVAAADTSCATTSALLDPDRFEVMWSGWIEALATMPYSFDASAQGQMLALVNGQVVAQKDLDGAYRTWPIDLLRGVFYPVRVYFRTASTASSAALEWTLPGLPREPVPAMWLHPSNPAVGTGLRAGYYYTFGSAEVRAQTDAAIDFFWPTPPIPAPPGPLSGDTPFAIRWSGQIMPSRTDTYTFYAQTDGVARIRVGTVDAYDSRPLPPPDPTLCAHGVCEIGGPINRACPQQSFCADRVCDSDPFCCYNTWDARCIDLAAGICHVSCATMSPPPILLRAGVKTDIEVEYEHTAGAGEMRLLWSGQRQSREIVPARVLFSQVENTRHDGSGLATHYFNDLDDKLFQSPVLTGVGPARVAWAAGGAPDPGRDVSVVCDGPSCRTTLGPPAILSPRDGAVVVDVAPVRITGVAARNGRVQIFVDQQPLPSQPASAADGSFSVEWTPTAGEHRLSARQTLNGVDSGLSASIRIKARALSALAPPVIVAPTDRSTFPGSQVTVTGSAVSGSTVVINVDGVNGSATPVAANGSFTTTITLGAPGFHQVSATAEMDGNRSPPTNIVHVGARPPRVRVDLPVSGSAFATSQVAVSGAGLASLGNVHIADGDGRYFETLTQLGVDAVGNFSGTLSLDPGQHQLKFFQMTPDGVGSDAVPILIGVAPPDAPQITTPADGAIVDSPVRVVGVGTATSLPGTATIYNDSKAAGTAPLTSGAFDGSVILPAGWRSLTATQLLPSLSGAGSTPSAPSAAVSVGVRPEPPRITLPLNGSTVEDLRVHLRGVAIPGTTVEIASGATSVGVLPADASGQFAGTLTVPNGAQLLTAIQVYQGIASHPSDGVYIAAGDVRGPALQVPAPMSVEADRAGGASVTFTATASDNRDGPVTPNCVPASGSVFPLGTTTVQCSARDAAGNLGTASFTVFVRDPTPPAISVPETIEAEAVGPAGAPVFYSTTANGSVGDCAHNGTASCAAWKPVGDSISCGTVQVFAIDPSNPAVLYAGGNDYLWKSVDRGKSWSLVTYQISAFDLVVDRNGDLYAVEKQGLSKSVDGGSNWFRVLSGDFDRYGLVLDPSRTGVLYILSESKGVFKTTDGGSTWVEMNDGLVLPPGPMPKALAIDASQPTTLYVGYVNGWIFKTTDGGQRWVQLNVPGISTFVRFLVVSPRDSKVIATNLVVTRDGGSTWAPAPFPWTTSWSFHPTDDKVWFASNGSTMKSVDAGITWVASDAGMTAPDHKVVFDPVDPDRLYAGPAPGFSFPGLHTSQDGGVTWTLLPGLHPSDCRGTALAVSPTDSEVAYAAFDATGIVKTTDGGRTWRSAGPSPAIFPQNRADAARAIESIAVDPSNPQNVWAASYAGIVRSADGGAHWGFVLNRGVERTGSVFAFDPTQPTKVYAATAVGLYRIEDGGATWAQLSNVPGGRLRGMAIDPRDPRKLYVVVWNQGVYRSTDQGWTWAPVEGTLDGAFHEEGHFVFDAQPSKSVIYIVGRRGRIVRSDDGGDTFTTLEPSFSCPFQTCPVPASGVAIDVTKSTPKLYWSYLGGLFGSVDRGAHFSDLGLNDHLDVLAVAPTDGTVYSLYAGNSNIIGSPVWRSTNAGDAPPEAGLVKGAIIPGCVPAPGTTFAIGDTQVTCTAKDALGQVTRRTFAVRVADTRAPVITVPADIETQADPGNQKTVVFGATAEDAVDGPIVPVCTPASGSSFRAGTTVVLCDAVDASGNRASRTFSVRVGDASAPNVVVPDDIVAGATGADGVVVEFAVSATGAEGPLVVDCVPASGSLFAIGTRRVVCSASDAAGNVGSRSFSVTVRDLTAPVVAVPPDQTAEATASEGAEVRYVAGATDAVDGKVSVTCTPGSGSTFPLGTSQVSCTARDRAGNVSAPATFSVTVVDTEPPVLVLPPGMTLQAEAESRFGARVAYDPPPSATDAVGVVSMECAPSSPAHEPMLFPIGANQVTCTASDAAGNITSGTFFVRVRDTTAPAVQVPGTLVFEAADASGAPVAFASTAFDLVDGALVPACRLLRGGSAVPIASGDKVPLGTWAIACDATDGANNTGSAKFSVVVRDTTPPVLTVPGDLIVDATSPEGAAVSYTVKANDAVDGAVPVRCLPGSGSSFAAGVTTPVVCQTSDGSGNPASRTFMVTVRARRAPALLLPGTLHVEATSAAGANVTYTASARDDVDGDLPSACLPPPGALFGAGDTDVACAATNSAGLTGTGTFSVEVRNTTPTVDGETVTVDEGQTAVNGGGYATFALAPVLNASSGVVTASGAGASGTWAWQLATIDGPADSRQVIIGSDGGFGIVRERAFQLVVRNVAPHATPPATALAVEGQPVTIALTGGDDPSPADRAAGLRYAFACDGGSLAGARYSTAAAQASVSCSFGNGPASPSVRARVIDKDDGFSEYTVPVTITNAPPVIVELVSPTQPLSIGAAAAVSARFSDAGAADAHTCVFGWDDGRTDTVAAAAGATTCTATHAYAAAGVYNATVTISDAEGGSATGSFDAIVVAGPEAGTAAGVGRFDSPAGAYVAEPTLTGPAQVAFVAALRRGATVPTGTTSFRFGGDRLRFASRRYDALSFSGGRALLRGTGTVNRSGDYGFLLLAFDGDAVTPRQADGVRIKIWRRSDLKVIYDNAPGPDELATSKFRPLTAGSVTVRAR